MMEGKTGPDRELVEKFQNSTGEAKEHAFSELYRRHERELTWYMMRLTGNRKSADDLTQEAFLRALKGLDEFRGDSKFKTWLYRIATNTWKNQLKKKRPLSGIVEEEDHVYEDVPDQIVERNERLEEVVDAVDQLSEKLRAALVLVRFEGMKYKEAASALDISMSALKSRISRAYDRLAEILTEKHSKLKKHE